MSARERREQVGEAGLRGPEAGDQPQVAGGRGVGPAAQGVEARRARIAAQAHARVQDRLASRLEPDLVAGRGVVERGRRRLEADPRDPLHPVEPAVGEPHPAVPDLGRELLPAPLAALAADLEQVGEVGGEPVLDRDHDRLAAEVAEHQPLGVALVAQHADAAEVQALPRQRHLVVRSVEVRVRQVAAQERVVVAHGRAEEERAGAGDQQAPGREQPRVAAVDALGRALLARDVAERVEHREGVAELERPQPPLRERLGGDDVEGRGVLAVRRLHDHPGIPRGPLRPRRSGGRRRRPPAAARRAPRSRAPSARR